MSELTPCSALQAPALIARVSSSMTDQGMAGHPPFAVRPGFCCFCNAKLGGEWLVSFVNKNTGEAEQRVYMADDPSFERLMFLQHHISLGPTTVMIWPEKHTPMIPPKEGIRHIGEHIGPVVLSAWTCCDALTSAIFSHASRIKREKSEAVAKAVRDRQYVATRAEQHARERAARAMSKDASIVPFHQ